MKETRLIICSEDEPYINALVAFLMRWEAKNKIGLFLCKIANVEELENVTGTFDLGLVETGFAEVLTGYPQIVIKNSLVLHEVSERRNEKDAFFKYQSMDELTFLIQGSLSRQAGESRVTLKNESRIISIYSPCNHELSLPFSLSVCKGLEESGETIFVDLEEICILPDLMDMRFESDLVDLMYMMENNETVDLNAYLTTFEGINILPPTRSPSQLSFLSAKHWEHLFLNITALGFKNIVILFGGLIQGLSNLLSISENIYVLGRDGDYYSMMERVFINYLEMLGIEGKSKSLHLPMSAQNLKAGAFRLEGLVSGHMLEFVKNMMGEVFGNYKNQRGY